MTALDTPKQTPPTLLAVEFTEVGEHPWPLDLLQGAQALVALNEFLDDVYTALHPGMFSLRWMRRAGRVFDRALGSEGAGTRIADRAYLGYTGIVTRGGGSTRLNGLTNAYANYFYLWLRLLGGRDRRLRRRGPSLQIVEMKQGSLDVLLEIGEWGAGGGAAGLMAALYLAQTHRSRVRKANTVLEAEAAEARNRLLRAQAKSIELSAGRFYARLMEAGLVASFELVPDASPGESRDMDAASDEPDLDSEV